MKFTEDRPSGHVIRAHSATHIQVDETWYAHSLIITADYLDSRWPPRHFAELTTEHLEPALTRPPEVLLLGTGQQLQFPSPRLLGPLHNAGIGIETMDTAAACRTFNLLMGEGRQVMAALIVELA